MVGRSLYEDRAVENSRKTGFLKTSFKNILGWARTGSVNVVPVGYSCCTAEIMQAFYGYETENLGIFFEHSIERADVLIVSGAVTGKNAEIVKKAYDSMPSPCWVMALGNCTLNGDKNHSDIIPVDIYVPGCPPSAEAIINGIMQLQKKMREL